MATDPIETEAKQVLKVQRNDYGVEATRTVLYEGFEVGEVFFHAEKLAPRGRKLDSVLEIEFNGENIFFHNPDIYSDNERIRAGNSAHRALSNIARRDAIEHILSVYSTDDFKLDLTTFALRAWPVYTDGQISELVAGDPDIKIPMLLPFLVQGGTTIAYGSPKTGKSWLGLLCCLHLDSGAGPLWEVKEPVPSMYINLERDDRFLTRRTGLLNRAFDMNPKRPLRFIHLKGKGNFLAHVDSIAADMKRFGIKFIVIDSITKMQMGDFNDNRVGAEMGNTIDRLLKDTGATCLAIGHSAKGQKGLTDETLLGAQSQTAFADVMVRIRSSRNPENENELGVRLEMLSANDTAPQEIPLTVLGFDRWGLSRIRKGSLREFPELREDFVASQDPVDRIAYTLDQENEPMSVKDITEALDFDFQQGRISRELRDSDLFKKGEGKRGKWGMASWNIR